ncbi:MAG: hypothetical protein Q7U53_09860 [Anaerolineaceae bacterium]|nr:hypothetical protein [Anaerolineaceae bacterium]
MKRLILFMFIFILILSTQDFVNAVSNKIVRVSVGENLVEGNLSSSEPSISGDGRHVAFSSLASNLVPDDTNNFSDVFVHDLQTNTTTRVSVNSAGEQADSGSGPASISGDGRYVAFRSGATNLVSGEEILYGQIFVHDRQTGQTVIVSKSSSGLVGNLPSSDPSISADGRFVAFQSLSDNLVTGDNNEDWDIFVHDLESQNTVLVSKSTNSDIGNGPSNYPSISENGYYVAFQSEATNLVSDDTNETMDVFLYNLQTGDISMISTGIGENAGNGFSGFPSISNDGRFTAFLSGASNLVENDNNATNDIFVFDGLLDTIERVSISSTGTEGNSYSNVPSISGNGRFVVYTSAATNLVDDDTNNREDIFLHDRETGETIRVNLGIDGQQANGFSFSKSKVVSDDGSLVTFYSWATNLVMNDNNNFEEVFVYGVESIEPVQDYSIFLPMVIK